MEIRKVQELKNSDLSVRVALAVNPSTAQAVLRILARDVNREVRMTAAHNPNAPVDVRAVELFERYGWPRKRYQVPEIS